MSRRELEPMRSRYWSDARDDFGRLLPRAARAAVSCDLQSTPYFEAMARASYYRWMAQRGAALSGNDPLSGSPRHRLVRNNYTVWREESRVAYKAMARYWLTMARRLRLASHFSQCQF